MTPSVSVVRWGKFDTLRISSSTESRRDPSRNKTELVDLGLIPIGSMGLILFTYIWSIFMVNV